MLITVGVEDLLSESVAKRLLAEYAPGFQNIRTEGLRGYGQLKSRFSSFNMIARYREPVLLITDLDNPQSCPVAIIREWSRNLAIEPHLLFRVAVVEIETWLIADRLRLAQWLGVSDSLISRYPESIHQPKESLVALARRSPDRRLRESIAPSPGGTRSVGPGYNDCLSEFVMSHWNPGEARLGSPSLDRAIIRIAELEARISL